MQQQRKIVDAKRDLTTIKGVARLLLLLGLAGRQSNTV